MCCPAHIIRTSPSSSASISVCRLRQACNPMRRRPSATLDCSADVVLVCHRPTASRCVLFLRKFYFVVDAMRYPDDVSNSRQNGLLADNPPSRSTSVLTGVIWMNHLTRTIPYSSSGRIVHSLSLIRLFRFFQRPADGLVLMSGEAPTSILRLSGPPRTVTRSNRSDRRSCTKLSPPLRLAVVHCFRVLCCAGPNCLCCHGVPVPTR